MQYVIPYLWPNTPTTVLLCAILQAVSWTMRLAAVLKKKGCNQMTDSIFEEVRIDWLATTTVIVCLVKYSIAIVAG